MRLKSGANANSYLACLTAQKQQGERKKSKKQQQKKNQFNEVGSTKIREKEQIKNLRYKLQLSAL